MKLMKAFSTKGRIAGHLIFLAGFVGLWSVLKAMPNGLEFSIPKFFLVVLVGVGLSATADWAGSLIDKRKL